MLRFVPQSTISGFAERMAPRRSKWTSSLPHASDDQQKLYENFLDRRISHGFPLGKRGEALNYTEAVGNN
ncbi:hypothetical protein Agabi119p4_11566 [Agaricus bisporus var. burnettii]|uniref:Uncharacterized protein n=1 Tax=Agaricus bisporus var. burnettii TaxID=192524 RepID=A0A8H7BZS3_AGABI|nr:hypothetical protein Agabi119p4_11566 [Agaricus bisporus var. burnettii]